MKRKRRRKKLKKLSAPKPRRVWAINPKTRVKPSGKIYKRAKKWIVDSGS